LIILILNFGKKLFGLANRLKKARIVLQLDDDSGFEPYVQLNS
jgi:hypothetical protein